MDCGPPGPSVLGILQARILEWVDIPFSWGSSWPRDQTQVSCTAGWFLTSGSPGEALRLGVWRQHSNKSQETGILTSTCLLALVLTNISSFWSTAILTRKNMVNSSVMSFWLFYVVLFFLKNNPDFFINHNACFWKYLLWYALSKSTSLWISEVLTSSSNNSVPTRCDRNSNSSDIRRMDLNNLCKVLEFLEGKDQWKQMCLC